MRGHPIARQPRIEKTGETSRLMLIDEDGVSRTTAGTRLAKLLREDLQRFIPAHELQLPILPRHWAAIAIRIIEALQCRLSAGAQCTAIHWVIRISLQLDRPSITSLGDDSAPDRAFAAGRRVIGRDAGHRLVRRYQIRNELLDLFGSASEHRGRGGTYSEDLEELPSLHAGGRCRHDAFGGILLGAHSISSGTRRNRISRGT